MYKQLAFCVIFVFVFINAFSQENQADYSNPKEYEIAGLSVSGIKYLDQTILAQFSGLRIGQKIAIPGEELSNAIDKYWKHGLFSDVQIHTTKINDNKVWIDFHLVERPRLSKVEYSGLRKTEIDDITKDVVKLKRGDQVTDNVINNTIHLIKKHFKEKGYLKIEVTVKQKDDSAMMNTVILYVNVNKKKKVKVEQVIIEDNKVLSAVKIKRAMKGTKERSFRNALRAKKFKQDKFEEDKEKVIAKYNKLGYRDAKIVKDTVYDFDANNVVVKLKIEEGEKYFYRNIAWIGNTKYKADYLTEILGIKKGDIFDQEFLDKRLNGDEDAVGNLYLNDGYLFYQCVPVETNITNDSIDMEMRIREGKQADVNRVKIAGNTRTNEHVIRREVRSLPGTLFSKSDITRTIRELAQMQYFDPEKLNINPVPNTAEGNVDLEYSVEEKANDQVEISGGWGSGMMIGTVGVRFGNFALKDIFKKKGWRPVPSGDGQQLSIRASSNGPRYSAFSISFAEPWLGGKKPNSFSVSVFRTQYRSTYTRTTDTLLMVTTGASLGFGKRLSWPDDYFMFYEEVSFQQYNLKYYPYFIIDYGKCNSLSFTTTLSRSSIDQSIFPRGGSVFSLTLAITPPYSMFTNKDWSSAENEEKYKWIEYHKWKFKAENYNRIIGNLVFMTKYELGILGYFNINRRSPFEGFSVGGDGMSGYSMYGRDVIALRGYANGAFSENSRITSGTANLYNKFTWELRYPVSLAASSTVWALAFVEAGNAWNNFKEFKPFDFHRSAGVGVRILLPMIGLMGIDWGYGFDPIPGASDQKKSQFHFVLGQQF